MSGDAIAVRPVLERVGGELVRLREWCDAAQDAAGLLAATCPGDIPAAAVVGLQSLDALSQHLSALSVFLRQVAAGLPAGLVADLAAADRLLPLEALRATLSGREPVGCEPVVELF